MTSFTRKDLGARLSELRKRAGLSQALAAESAGLSDETISRLERGAQGVSVDALTQLARAYGVELTEVFVVTRKRDEKTAAIDRVVALLKGHSAAQIDMVGDLILAWSNHSKVRAAKR